ncbi:MAG: DUF1566 domain-containing protein, partial [Bacteroidales bacterium]|nr:DUF1566 domain-containing protein [Bacteroidales bacterium]
MMQSPQEAPQEAIDACSGKSSGASCSFSGLRGESVTGACDSRGICVPEDKVNSQEVVHNREVQNQEVSQEQQVPKEESRGFFGKIFNFLFGWIGSGEDEVEFLEPQKEVPKEQPEILDSSEEDSSLGGDKEETITTLISSVIVDTNQRECFDEDSEITCPSSGQDFYGQDGNYGGNQPSYLDNEDGTVTDLNTGLMWLQDAGNKVDYFEGVNAVDSFEFAGYDDWRVPTVKELYSLMDFSGEDVDLM